MKRCLGLLLLPLWLPAACPAPATEWFTNVLGPDQDHDPGDDVPRLIRTIVEDRPGVAAQHAARKLGWLPRSDDAISALRTAAKR